MLLDRQGRCLNANRAGVALLGLNENNIIGKKFEDIWPANSKSVVQNAIRRTLSKGLPHSFETVFYRTDGGKSIMNVVLSPIFNSKGGVSKLIGTSTDITTIKDAGQRLKTLLEGSMKHIPQLSNREKEVLGWLVHGKTTGDISAILDISERTVKFHVGNILRKLDAVSRTHAVAIAVDMGLIDKK